MMRYIAIQQLGTIPFALWLAKMTNPLFDTLTESAQNEILGNLVEWLKQPISMKTNDISALLK